MTAQTFTERVDAEKVVPQIHQLGDRLGDEMVEAEVAVTFTGSEQVVLQGARDDVEFLLGETLLLLRSQPKLHNHRLEVRRDRAPFYLHCLLCEGNFLDMDTVKRISICQPHWKDHVGWDLAHIWQVTGPEDNPHCDCAICGGESLNAPCKA